MNSAIAFFAIAFTSLYLVQANFIMKPNSNCNTGSGSGSSGPTVIYLGNGGGNGGSNGGSTGGGNGGGNSCYRNCPSAANQVCGQQGTQCRTFRNDCLRQQSNCINNTNYVAVSNRTLCAGNGSTPGTCRT